MLTWLPTALAVLAGVGLGLVTGGQLSNLKLWRPAAWPLLVGGLALEAIIRVSGLGGGWAVVVDLVAGVALIAFCVLNIRVGGMILIVIGLSLNLLPTLVNWGIPVSGAAVSSAGLVRGGSIQTTLFDGPRHLEDDGDHLTFLGEVIGIPPTKQVISVGDLVLLFGYALTCSALLRNRRVAGEPLRLGRLGGRGVRSGGGGSGGGGSGGGIPYHEAIKSLGDGPAPRRGPGTHPARMADQLKRPAAEGETAVRRLPPAD